MPCLMDEISGAADRTLDAEDRDSETSLGHTAGVLFPRRFWHIRLSHARVRIGNTESFAVKSLLCVHMSFPCRVRG